MNTQLLLSPVLHGDGIALDEIVVMITGLLLLGGTWIVATWISRNKEEGSHE